MRVRTNGTLGETAPDRRAGTTTWRPLPAALITTLTLVFSTGAQSVPDHLKCYKVRDPQARATYTADLDGLAAEPGCTIKVPAIVACVPATKTNVRPAPPGGGGTGMPNAFGCYKIKCPKAMLPAIPLNDQFGTRSLRRRRRGCSAHRRCRRPPPRRSLAACRPAWAGHVSKVRSAAPYPMARSSAAVARWCAAWESVIRATRTAT